MPDLTPSAEGWPHHGAKAARLVAAGSALVLAACLNAAPIDAAATPHLERTPAGRSVTLAFADEFDIFRPFRQGAGIWRTTFRDGRDDHDDDFNLRTLKWNKELQLYVDPDMRSHPGRHEDREVADFQSGAKRPDRGQPLGLNPFSVRDGVLEIRAERASPSLARDLGGFAYTSGLITTQPSFQQTYGYFEIRAKLPRGKGVWPAFWLLPVDLSWPPEIDIMESIGDPGTVFVTLHSNAVKAEGTAIQVEPDAFHTYAVSWAKDEVIWFVDGREVKRMATPSDMHKPMYMLANVALGGDWAGQPDATTPFPARLQIDHIRAYRFAP